MVTVNETNTRLRDLTLLALGAAVFGVAGHVDLAAEAEPAPCVCPDVDRRVAAELRACITAQRETAALVGQSNEQWESMRAGCMWLPQSTNLGRRPVARSNR